MRRASSGLFLLFAATGAMAKAPDPFPAGYDAAYAAYLASLAPAERRMPWLAQMKGVAAPAEAIRIGGQPAQYITTCKPHDCGDNIAIIFLPADRKQARTVLRLGGRDRLIGGAGPREAACAQALRDSGWTTKAC